MTDDLKNIAVSNHLEGVQIKAYTVTMPKIRNRPELLVPSIAK